MSIGKWIAGGLGWALFGPLGGILGFLAGTALETGTASRSGQGSTGSSGTGGRTTRGDFTVSLVVLTAAVMKADGRVTKAELDYVKKYLLRSFGQQAATDAIRMLRDVLKQEIPVDEVSRQIGRNLDYSSRLQLLHYLFGISGADGHTHPLEVELIQRIASYMQVSSHDFNSIKAMFVKDTQSAYKILGVANNASNDEIKKAYRKMAAENHPDKVAYLGEEIRKDAEEKFRKINEAYEAIKKERGLS